MPQTYSREYYLYRKNQRIKEHRCLRCGKLLTYRKSKWCAECREKHNEYKRQHRKKQQKPPCNHSKGGFVLLSQKAGDFMYLLICQSDVVSCGIVGADDDITNYRLTVNSCAIKQRCKNVDFGGIVKKPLIVTSRFTNPVIILTPFPAIRDYRKCCR